MLSQKLSLALVTFALSTPAFAATGFDYDALNKAYNAAIAPTPAQVAGNWSQVGAADDSSNSLGSYSAQGLGPVLTFSAGKNPIDGSSITSVAISGFGDSDAPAMAVQFSKDGADFDTANSNSMSCRIVKATGNLLCYYPWNDSSDSDANVNEYDIYVKR